MDLASAPEPTRAFGAAVSCYIVRVPLLHVGSTRPRNTPLRSLRSRYI